jgi:SAM-dependent methyltransferase
MYAANKRSGFSGVWQIFLYNWHFYAATLALDLVAALLMKSSFPTTVRLGVGVVAAVSTFWVLSSLLASHYIYDLSRLSEWHWLTEVLEKSPDSWLNIHAGLDQTSDSLMRLFPAARHRILDIYFPSEMSEPSIQRARRHAQPPSAPETANPFILPLENCERDVVFVIFAAHELRRRESRLKFFRELRRILRPSGRIVLVEHLRDWKNFVVYGPGVFHFFSRRDWLLIGTQAGFNGAHEVSITPFVRCFVLTKPTFDSTEDSHESENAPCD